MCCTFFSDGKEGPLACRGHRLGPWVRKIPGKEWQPAPASLLVPWAGEPGGLHSQRQRVKQDD